MYVVHPILRHFFVWIILIPLVLVETSAFREFLNESALQDPAKTQEALGLITKYQKGDDEYTVEIQYRFQIPNDPTWYSASDMTGRRSLWIPVTRISWDTGVKAGNQIGVIYLKSDPWVNQPISRTGNPIGDSLCGWSLLLAADIYGLYELFLIIKNYVRCRKAAEQGQASRLRYWESREF